MILDFFFLLVIRAYFTVPPSSIAFIKFLGERAVPLSGELRGLRSSLSKLFESFISVSTYIFLAPEAIMELAMPGPSFLWLNWEILEMFLTSEPMFGSPEVLMVWLGKLARPATFDLFFKSLFDPNNSCLFSLSRLRRISSLFSA